MDQAPENKQQEGSIAESFEQSGEPAPVVGSVIDSGVGGDPDPVAAAPEVKPEPIKIGSKLFNNETEAAAYVAELEQERMASNAYRQAVQDVQSAQQPAHQPQAEEPVDRDGQFYEAPTKYIDSKVENIRESVTKEIREEFERKDAVKEMWNQFYSKNSDLQGEDDLVQLTLTKEWDVVANMKDRNKAMDIVAQKTRERLHKVRDKFIPQQELSNKPADASRGSSAPPMSKPSVADEPALDFASQINNTQKGRYGIY